jgi:hypothetical protein
LGERLAALVTTGEIEPAVDLLSPLLAERTSFAVLRRIAAPVGGVSIQPANRLLARIAEGRTEGGWVVIATVLDGQLGYDLADTLVRCRDYIVQANVWYAADILGEGVAGQALLRHFGPALDQLATWREDAEVWVRRALGTAVHFWAKRSQGAPELTPEARALLALLAPMFGEWEMDAAKGIGWGLKTMGRYYPDLVADWLAQDVIPAGRRHRALMLRKALTFLSGEQRARATSVGADR